MQALISEYGNSSSNTGVKASTSTGGLGGWGNLPKGLGSTKAV